MVNKLILVVNSNPPWDSKFVAICQTMLIDGKLLINDKSPLQKYLRGNFSSSWSKNLGLNYCSLVSCL